MSARTDPTSMAVKEEEKEPVVVRSLWYDAVAALVSVLEGVVEVVEDGTAEVVPGVEEAAAATGGGAAGATGAGAGTGPRVAVL
jgi:hypothetical protein